MKRNERGYEFSMSLIAKKCFFLRSGGPSKIRLLQCYMVLWIHVIDAICTTALDTSMNTSFGVYSFFSAGGNTLIFI